MEDQLSIGVIGAGGFAAFAAKAFLKIENVSIKGVFDVDAAQALQLAQEVDAKVFDEYLEMLQDDSIDLIYIATPPFLHYAQSLEALQSGKHVICEKPAALKASEAEELSALAKSKDLLYVVNLMQRYNPLYVTVRQIIDEKWLGDFVHGFFENYASDEKLVEEHWFWDRQKSGGIFIEHAVHFFDMFEGWLGPGRLVHAMEVQRSGHHPEMHDCVQAVVLYNNHPVNFYHGFNQPKVLDRQEMRLQFERGDITLYEWVPVSIRIHGLFTKDQFARISEAFPVAHIKMHDLHERNDQVRGNFKSITFDELMTITSGDQKDKMQRYEEMVIAMLRDQWAWIRDHAHQRVIDDRNAISSVRIAEEATSRAERY